MFPVETRSEHHPVTYQPSLHGAVSDSKAAQTLTDQLTTAYSYASNSRVPISISETPSTQTFDNTLVDFPAVTSSSQRHRLQDSMTSSLSSVNQQRQVQTTERHWLPDPTTSSSSANQRMRNEMLEYFAVRRPQVKWKRPVRLPPTNSERALKTTLVYQSRSQVSQRASSNLSVSNMYTNALRTMPHTEAPAPWGQNPAPLLYGGLTRQKTAVYDTTGRMIRY